MMTKRKLNYIRDFTQKIPQNQYILSGEENEEVKAHTLL